MVGYTRRQEPHSRLRHGDAAGQLAGLAAGRATSGRYFIRPARRATTNARRQVKQALREPTLGTSRPSPRQTAAPRTPRPSSDAPTLSALLARPTALTLDRHGAVYVLDAGAARVLRLSPQGQVLARFAVPGTGQPPDLAGLAVDVQGNVFVADGRQRRIYKLAPTGEPLAQWEHRGLCPRCPASPAGIALDAAGCLYVADCTGPAVQKLSSRGEVLAEWRGPSHFGLFHRPAVVALDAGGYVYVADEGNHAIHRLSPAGEPVGYWGGEGERPGQLRAPRGLVVDPQGNLYVADAGNARVQKLASNGRCRAVLGSKGHGPGQLWSPVAVALNSAGCLYVADEGNGRILKLSPDGSPLAQWGPRHRLVARPACEWPGGEPDSWREGGYYSLEPGDGGIAIAWVLAVDAGAIHVRLYRDRIAHRPKDDRVPPVSLGEPGAEEGVGQAHLALTSRLFAAWHPRFINKAQVKPRHLREYRAWRAARGAVWDLDLGTEHRG